jgi:hypothetical protein
MDSLVSQWGVYNLRNANGFKSFPWNDVPFYWQQVLTEMGKNDKRLQVQNQTEEEFLKFRQAAMWYCKEKCELRESVDGDHPDFEPDEAPWD